MLSAEDALALYSLFAPRGLGCWIMGGWGVDALVGRETRPHHDLDLLVAYDDLGAFHDVLTEHGFTRKLVWDGENRWVDVAGSLSPTAFVEVDELGRELDLHVIERVRGLPPVPLCDVPWQFDLRSLEGVGSIGGARVRCLTASTQLQMHTGYDLPEEHLRDVDLLRELSEPPPKDHP
ncbi:MAG TPA: hypothetical protein VEV13_03575 [Candidatus Limnocylindria bacterium]|nr:hypothetical protein [Candidatus Limnocylindria bacterium]